ncbi:exodeoxyribonuclease VII large subunit [Clostridium thermosuccinogenes]|uniref:Exodeoxyribonuclease 7 large subunit n=1 Tax=Clostridium thermosuccinogenes TaxID=84032 RepID=A0A2K2F2Y1_9CLOT|nr:exodeoxyribonuclease VII large subunit [Pseudoclostridium thermosuccinogenes]AUS96169.1 exodeoxyribonuclease VII large subunit [Pseudoclostridium thermosuccinogenes]PNT93148.1 exodeoxyribonuclease VII large subunit [Pseudoclostridium thermosuccinogenes]PNT98749.1 exodeoxyribonuclease VII large subunit [Pseudoclostridium thermosuccinogenes]PNU00748.1 exodeoxyribonuclease VII large subunit [Pseudoclostridium thermosuccinogenes]
MRYILSVSEINSYIKDVISRDLILSNLWVRGEISNYKYHYSGHMYFTLKDESSVLKCVMFKSYASALKFQPENGMKVIIKGYVSVFERDGQYQLYVEEMQADGLGNLHLAFEQLKKKLQEEGLFDPSHKKKIPLMPERIGVVTSSTGAVIRDIINVVSRRFRNVEIKIFPTAVQGEQAAGQISRAIRKLNELNCVDVIIVARGGGSLEELWPFNEEIVARSIYESKIPVISAVGHETDFTIADFVADLRAPTPSAAAEIVVPEKYMMVDRIQNLNSRLKNSLINSMKMNKMRYIKVMNRLPFRQPYDRVYQERMRLDVLGKSMYKSLLLIKRKAASDFGLLAGKLDSLSPLSILARGYSIAKQEGKGKIIKSVKDVNTGDRVRLEVSDGEISCVVDGISDKNAFFK